MELVTQLNHKLYCRPTQRKGLWTAATAAGQGFLACVRWVRSENRQQHTTYPYPAHDPEDLCYLPKYAPKKLFKLLSFGMFFFCVNLPKHKSPFIDQQQECVILKNCVSATKTVRM
jgi:hypothetical protein